MNLLVWILSIIFFIQYLIEWLEEKIWLLYLLMSDVLPAFVYPTTAMDGPLQLSNYLLFSFLLPTSSYSYFSLFPLSQLLHSISSSTIVPVNEDLPLSKLWMKLLLNHWYLLIFTHTAFSLQQGRSTDESSVLSLFNRFLNIIPHAFSFHRPLTSDRVLVQVQSVIVPLHLLHTMRILIGRDWNDRR